jgi:uncharacterized protein Veg
MLRRLLSLVLAGLLVSVGGAVHARSQGDEQARRIEKIKQSVCRLGVGKDARVEIKLQDGRKLKGYIRETTDNSFSVVDEKTGTVTSVNYSDVLQLKGKNHLTAAKVGINVAKGVAIVAGVAAAFTLLMYIFVPRT